MSATEVANAWSEDSTNARAIDEPRWLRYLELVSICLAVGLLLVEFALHRDSIAVDLAPLLPWIAVVAVADLMPVPLWGTVELMISFPILLAAAFVFPPYVVALLGLVATLDAREVRREISLMRGLLNRANVALSVYAAGTVFQALGGDVHHWPEVLVQAAPSVAADVFVNASLLILGTHLLTGHSARALFVNVYGGEQQATFILGYLAFGLLAVLLATVYSAAGAWGLLAFAIPLLLARQMFVQWKCASTATSSLGAKQRVLSEVTTRMADERRDERLTLAAGIHDEVLPPLYQVHLMGEVLKRDLASGRLLDLEADLPDLLHATQAANDALRDLIGDLRESKLGPGGLVETLRLLIRQLEGGTTARFEAELWETGGTPLTQLLVYQIAREAITNAAVHSGARRILISLRSEDGFARLRVQDDGRGFDIRSVDESQHFGLQLMRERAELAGGLLVVESGRGSGTEVVLRLPVEERPRE